MRLIRHFTLTIAALVVVVGIAWFLSQRAEPQALIGAPIEGAYWLCSECGLSHDETDQLVNDARQSTLTREEQFDVFLDAFEGRVARGVCQLCAEAVLAAAAD